VETLNAKWQRYDSSREDYVRVLYQRLKEYTTPTPDPTPTPTPTPTSTSSREAGSGQLLLFQQEIARLNRLLADKMDECVRLGREMEESRWRDRERVQTLEQQVRVHITSI